MTPFLTNFQRFPITFQRFLKIFQNCSEGQTNVSGHFPKISEDFWRLPKIVEDDRRRSGVSIIHQPIQQKQKAGILTSLNDTTLTKMTYGKYATLVPDEVVYGIYEWFSSQ